MQFSLHSPSKTKRMFRETILQGSHQQLPADRDKVHRGCDNCPTNEGVWLRHDRHCMLFRGLCIKVFEACLTSTREFTQVLDQHSLGWGTVYRLFLFLTSHHTDCLGCQYKTNLCIGLNFVKTNTDRVSLTFPRAFCKGGLD